MRPAFAAWPAAVRILMPGHQATLWLGLLRRRASETIKKRAALERIELMIVGSLLAYGPLAFVAGPRANKQYEWRRWQRLRMMKRSKIAQTTTRRLQARAREPFQIIDPMRRMQARMARPGASSLGPPSWRVAAWRPARDPSPDIGRARIGRPLAWRQALAPSERQRRRLGPEINSSV